MNFRDLKLRVRALVAPRRVERELDEELAFHIEHETQKHVASGLSPADARARALARFGSPTLVADQCRDARGTAFLDALARDIRYAFTTFRRAPLAALTIVGTAALGLGLIAVVFTFYNALFLRTDAVRNPGELFEVRRPPSPGANVWIAFTRPDYEAVRRDTSVFVDAFARLLYVEARIEGRPTNAMLVTGNFFQVLGANAALGRVLMPDDDERFVGRPVIVLSHRGWTRLFANDVAAIGRSVPVNGMPYEVIGVMPPEFRGLASVLTPDYWAPLGLLGHFQQSMAGKEDAVAIEIVGRLKPGMPPDVAAAALSAWAAANSELKAVRGQSKTIRLEPSQGTRGDALEGLVWLSPVFFAFGLILMIACANVANLLLARGVSRQREIGIRLSLGGSRQRIIRQLLTESLLLALAAAACGFAIGQLVLEATVRLTVATVSPETAEQIGLAAVALDWRVIAFLLCGAVVSTVFFGLVPALQATRLELVRTLRGEVTKDARPSRLRNALIAAQVGASALLLICAAVFLRGAFRAATLEPGLRTSDTVLLEMANEPLRAPMLQAVSADPAVAAVAASWPHWFRGELAEASAFAAASADKTSSAEASENETGPQTSATVPVEYKFVSPEYFDVFAIDIVRGRAFRQAERSPSAGVAIVSDRTSRRLWPDREAIGQIVHLDPFENRGALGLGTVASAPQLPFDTFTVVGVVRDAQVGIGITKQTSAGVYLPIDAATPETSLILRVRGDPDQAREALTKRLSMVDPAMGEITTVRSIAGRGIYILQAAFWVTAALGGLALLLTVSGLFSVLSYIVAQRSKEIGVRMALGATTRNVAGLVLSQSIRPVAVGLIAGAAFAGQLAIVLMAPPLALGVGEAISVYDPVAYAGSLLCILAACVLAALIPALRAARIDPIATLRQD